MILSVGWWSRSACNPESEGFLREIASGINSDIVIKEWNIYTSDIGNVHVRGIIDNIGILVG